MIYFRKALKDISLIKKKSFFRLLFYIHSTQAKNKEISLLIVSVFFDWTNT